MTKAFNAHLDNTRPPITTVAESNGIGIVIRWGVYRARMEPLSITFESGPKSPMFTANKIRQLPIGDVIAASREATGKVTFIKVTLMDKKSTANRREPRRGVRPSTDEIADVAAVYLQAWAANESVNAAVRKAFGLTSSGAAKRIMAVRDAGLLRDVGPRPSRTRS